VVDVKAHSMAHVEHVLLRDETLGFHVPLAEDFLEIFGIGVSSADGTSDLFDFIQIY
jgi:hypothetical protein